MKYDVFINYSHQEMAIMHRIQERLEQAGLKVWSDEKLTVGTESWINEIETGLKESSTHVVILSPDAKKSKWVQQELYYALSNNKLIIPFLISGDAKESIPFIIFQMQLIDARQNFDEAMKLLVDVIQKHISLLPSSSADAPVSHRIISTPITTPKVSTRQLLLNIILLIILFTLILVLLIRLFGDNAEISLAVLSVLLALIPSLVGLGTLINFIKQALSRLYTTFIFICIISLFLVVFSNTLLNDLTCCPPPIFTPSATFATPTPNMNASATAAIAGTAIAIRQTELALTPSATPTEGPTLSATEIESTIQALMVLVPTQDASTKEALVQAGIAAQTATATNWTATPLPNAQQILETANARITETVVANITAEAAISANANATLVASFPTPSPTYSPQIDNFIFSDGLGNDFQGTVYLQYPLRMNDDSADEIRVEIVIEKLDQLAPFPLSTEEFSMYSATNPNLEVYLRGVDTTRFTIDAVPPNSMRQMTVGQTNWWKWNIRPIIDHSSGANFLEIQIYAHNSDSESTSDLVEVIPFRLEVTERPFYLYASRDLRIGIGFVITFILTVAGLTGLMPILKGLDQWRKIPSGVNLVSPEGVEAEIIPETRVAEGNPDEDSENTVSDSPNTGEDSSPSTIGDKTDTEGKSSGTMESNTSF